METNQYNSDDSAVESLRNHYEGVATMEPFLGQIQLFAFNYAPRGWIFAEGQVLSVLEYPNLFDNFGSQFGGDGRTNFALPDLKGKEPVPDTHHCISLEGGVQEIGRQQFLGQIQLFAFDFEPLGWAFADGQALGIAANVDLFNLLGFQFGGDGSTTFALPNLKGKEPVPNTRYCIALDGIFPTRF